MPSTRTAWVLFGALALGAAAPRPAPSPTATPALLDVQSGVRIEVRLDQTISTQDNRTGDRFTFETTREFLVGTLVVPRNTHGRGIIELVEPRSGKDHGGRLSISVESLDLGDGRAIPIALPPVESALHIGDQSDAGGVPRYGAVVVLDADESGNVVLHKGETFAVITTSTGTPQPIPHSEST